MFINKDADLEVGVYDVDKGGGATAQAPPMGKVSG